MRRFICFVREVIAKRRSSGPVPPVTADAVGTFEIAGTVSLIDHVEVTGSFDIIGTVTIT